MDYGSTRGAYYRNRYDEMLEDRRPIEEWWQIISEFVLPRKSYVTETEDYADDTRYRRLYDTTAISACNTLANGHSSYITPGDQRWFYWGAPDNVASEEAESWYRKCSEIAALELAASNFYTSFDEGYLDRSGFGICNVSAWPGRRTALNFQVHAVNSYVIEEGIEGFVDTMGRCFTKNIRQLQQMFGDEIQKSSKLAASWEDFKLTGKAGTHKIIHHVHPRSDSDRQPGSKEGKDLPIASVYICQDDNEIIYEGGFEEMPYCCSRYLKHEGRGNQYGFSPSWRAMPAISQLNFLQKIMDALAEKQAFPPVLVPDYLEGDVDLRAGGMTMFMAGRVKGAHALPQEWGQGGRYDIGAHRVEQKQGEVNTAFHVDLFRLFADLDRPNMTATEVAERSGEKMIQFSPSFTRFVSDFQVCMQRVFGILLRAGRFPNPPQEAIQQDPYSGELSVGDPKVIYQSKIALALQQLQNTAIDRMLQRGAVLVEAGRPDALDGLNVDQIMREYGRNDGVPEEIFLTEEQTAELRETRAQQQEEERQMALVEQGAKAAGAVGMTAA